MSVVTKDIDTQRRDIDMATAIAELEPNATPFTVVMKKSATKKTRTAEFGWWEDELGPRLDAINNAAGYLDTDTDLVVDNAAYFAAHDVVKVHRTDEVMRVTGVNTGTNTLTVVRGWGTTSAAALVDNDVVQIIGNANAEDTLPPAQKVGQPTKAKNYAQIFRTLFGVSGTVQAERQITGKERTRLQRKKGIEHMIDLERALLYGESMEDATGGEVRRATGGILSFITTNVYDAGGNLTETDFDKEFCEMAFDHGSETKVLMGCSRLCSLMTTWAKGKLQIVQAKKNETFGLTVREYISAHGRLLVVHHPLLTGSVYGRMGIVVDTSKIAFRPLRDTKLRTNVQEPGRDGLRDEYLTEAGLEVKNQKCHAVIKNVDAA